MAKNRPRLFLFPVIAFLLVPAQALAAESASPANEQATETDPAARMSEGEVIGPQPGPDQALKSPDNPYRNEVEAIQEGRRMFVWFNCSGCHGGRAGGGMGPSLRDAEWLYGNSHNDVYNSIAEGRAFGMPAWGMKLPPESIWKITAYIKSMNTQMEPDKPPENPVYPDPPPRRDVKGVKAGGNDEDDEDQGDDG